MDDKYAVNNTVFTEISGIMQRLKEIIAFNLHKMKMNVLVISVYRIILIKF